MTEPVVRIACDRTDLYAFEIHGEVSDEAMKAMAKTMTDAFDAHEDKVDMLLVFRAFDGSETGATFDMDVVTSQVRSLTNIARYVVVGAPDAISTLIETMGKMMPVEAHTFPREREADAWAMLGARRLDA